MAFENLSAQLFARLLTQLVVVEECQNPLG